MIFGGDLAHISLCMCPFGLYRLYRFFFFIWVLRVQVPVSGVCVRCSSGRPVFFHFLISSAFVVVCSCLLSKVSIECIVFLAHPFGKWLCRCPDVLRKYSCLSFHPRVYFLEDLWVFRPRCSKVVTRRWRCLYSNHIMYLLWFSSYLPSSVYRRYVIIIKIIIICLLLRDERITATNSMAPRTACALCVNHIIPLTHNNKIILYFKLITIVTHYWYHDRARFDYNTVTGNSDWLYFEIIVKNARRICYRNWMIKI